MVISPTSFCPCNTLIHFNVPSDCPPASLVHGPGFWWLPEYQSNQNKDGKLGEVRVAQAHWISGWAGGLSNVIDLHTNRTRVIYKHLIHRALGFLNDRIQHVVIGPFYASATSTSQEWYVASIVSIPSLTSFGESGISLGKEDAIRTCWPAPHPRRLHKGKEYRSTVSCAQYPHVEMLWLRRRSSYHRQKYSRKWRLYS